MAARATQERTLGSIIGMGIGDALGMPLAGMTAAQIHEKYGSIDRYHAGVFEDGTALEAGEFSDETEIALCIMETYTSANGDLDPELIRARMQFLARGESRRWMNPATLQSLDDEDEPWFRSATDDDPEVVLRGLSIGMIHAAPRIDEVALRRDVETVVGLTHSSQKAVDLAVVVAMTEARVLSGQDDQTTLLQTLTGLTSNSELKDVFGQMASELPTASGLSEFMTATATGKSALDVVTSGIAAFVLADRFEDAVFAAAAVGGAADSRGTLAGALAGAHFGAGGIPQMLIDDLQGRIYLTLAAPWFYRTIQLMTGRGIAIG